MKKIIIVEGPDNIGKTTLCQRLAEETGGKVIHCGPPKAKGKAALKEQLKLLHTVLARLEEETGPKIEIWDRSVIGECVYGPMYRASQYKHVTYRDEIQALKRYEQQLFAVVCYADALTLRQWKLQPKDDEDEVYQKSTETTKISVAFVDVATQLALKNTLLVNGNNYLSLDDRNDYVSVRVACWLRSKRYVFKRTNDYQRSFFNATQRIWKRTAGFVENEWGCGAYAKKSCQIGNDHRELMMYGNRAAAPISAVGADERIRYVFVGESTGYNTNGLQLGMPFYNGESGCLFQTALTALHILPTQYYLTNVVKCNPKDNRLGNYVNRYTRQTLECVEQLAYELQRIIVMNRQAKIVAVGKVAAEELARMKIDHVMSYHPAYYLRGGRSDDFIVDLRRLLA